MQGAFTRAWRSSGRCWCTLTTYDKGIGTCIVDDAYHRAGREACRLAKDQGSHLRIIHVVDEIMGASPPSFGSAYEALTAELRKAGRSILAGAESFVHTEGLTAEAQLVEAI